MTFLDKIIFIINEMNIMAKKETTKKNTTEKKATKKARTVKTVKPTEKNVVLEKNEEVLEVTAVQAINTEQTTEEPNNEITSLVPEEIVTETQPEEYESAKPAKKKEENNQRPSKIRKILGYFWNGQEFDY